jgi:hypothetical protein
MELPGPAKSGTTDGLGLGEERVEGVVMEKEVNLVV